MPFLASPMGKGVMPDSHPLSVGAARSHALQNADVVFLMGARLNWVMHFGLPPRFNKNVRIVQLDIAPDRRLQQRRLRQDDGGLPTSDLLIASTALHRDDELVTGNPRHYDRIPDLVVRRYA